MSTPKAAINNRILLMTFEKLLNSLKAFLYIPLAQIVKLSKTTLELLDDSRQLRHERLQ